MRRVGSSGPRPYWHIDAKWFTGLLLVIALGLTVMAYNLKLATEEKAATDTLALTYALTFSQQGLDDQAEIDSLKAAVEAAPDKTFKPVPGMNVTIVEEDLVNHTPREIRLNYFRKWAEPFYNQGLPGMLALAENEEMKKSLGNGMGILAIFTKQTHDIIETVFRYLVAVTAILLILMVFFSHRFGRLFSPGAVFLIAATPGALLIGLYNKSLSGPPAVPDYSGGATAMAGYLAANILPPILRLFYDSYLAMLKIGVLLIVMAILGKLFWWLIYKSRSKKEPTISLL